MREFRVDKKIRAPVERVWSVLADIDTWPQWTPSISRIERLDPGPLGVGSSVRVHQPKLRPAVWVVTVWEPRHRFVWQTVAPGVTVVGGHFLEVAEEGCAATLDLHFRGFLGSLVGFVSRNLTDRYIQLEAEGLKTRSESSM
jgi:hypothetical protein